jgi:membrane-associated phospholipid phosphatase
VEKVEWRNTCHRKKYPVSRKKLLNPLWICPLSLMFCISLGNVAHARNKFTTRTAVAIGTVVQVLIPATAYVTTFVLDDKEGRNQFYKSFLLNEGITYGLKYTVNEARPDGHGKHSFPSGHTSASFQGAAFIHRRYGWQYSVPAYIAAALVGYSRIGGEYERHYVKDVVAGAAIGVLSSYLFTTPYHRVTVTPVKDGGFSGAWVSVKW